MPYMYHGGFALPARPWEVTGAPIDGPLGVREDFGAEAAGRGEQSPTQAS
jgi:hypothetical protein